MSTKHKEIIENIDTIEIENVDLSGASEAEAKDPVRLQMQEKGKDWEKIVAAIDTFALPAYGDIPDVGLFLEQTSRYICGCLEPFASFSLTGSMISNYVKKKLIANPVKKMYSREQIAYLFFVTIAKSVLALEDIQLMINMQKETFDSETAYEYFRAELRNILLYVYGLKDSPDQIGTRESAEKAMLRNIIITAAHKAYLDSCFRMLK